MMLLLRGADEAVERDVQALIHFLEPRRRCGSASSTASALASRGLDHLQAVLVGAGEEKHVLAVEPLKARQRIGRDRLIGVADMRRAVGIRDRGRDVVDDFARDGADCCALARRRPSCSKPGFGRFLQPSCWCTTLVLRRRFLADLAVSWAFFAAGFLRPVSWLLSSPLSWRFSLLPSWPSSHACLALGALFRARGPWPGALRFANLLRLFRFLEVFFLAVATTNSFIAQTDCRD